MQEANKQPLGFGKTMLASSLGVVIAFVVINILGFFLMTSILLNSLTSSKKPVAVENDTFLKLDLTLPTPERAPSEVQSLFSIDKIIGLTDILQSIDAAKSDDRINGIYVVMNAMTSQSWGQCEELRIALQDFKKSSGKPVIAYSDTYTQNGYYIASVADRIFMHPAGNLDWRGIMAQPMFYKDLLAKFDIHMNLIRPKSNAYKSAGETYTMDHMSEANKEQVRAYITSTWNHVVNQISVTRNITPTRLNEIADGLLCYKPENAVAEGMIDTLGFEFDAKKLMKDKYEMDKLLDIADYKTNVIQKNKNNHIAIIYAEGDVVPGESTGVDTKVYGDDVAKAFDDATEDESVKAIVLRVNSPGGAVTASEIMTAAVMRAKEKKPVIVSMSDLAASAGYEISCNATKIVAHPTTLTGSIGVFGTIPEIGTALKKHLGISTDTVMTNANSGGIYVMRPMSPKSYAALQQSIEDFYITFITRVAKGRGMKVEDVDKIARGRVWTGADAIKIGLVDTLGNFATAINIAAKEAQIDEYSLVYYPEEKNLMTQLLDLTSSTKIRSKLFSKHEYNPIENMTKELESWANMEPLQARLPFILNME